MPSLIPKQEGGTTPFPAGAVQAKGPSRTGYLHHRAGSLSASERNRPLDCNPAPSSIPERAAERPTPWPVNIAFGRKGKRLRDTSTGETADDESRPTPTIRSDAVSPVETTKSASRNSAKARPRIWPSPQRRANLKGTQEEIFGGI